MPEIIEKKYRSLWDVVHEWGNQGLTGYIKFGVWCLIAATFFLGFLPYILAPLFNSEFGIILGAIIYFGTVVAVQVIGNKLKVEVKTKT